MEGMDGNDGQMKETLHIASVRFEGKNILPTLEELPQYSEDMLPSGIKNKDELLAEAVLAVANYTNKIFDLISTGGPQTPESLLMLVPGRFDLPTNVKTQIIEQLTTDGRLFLVGNGEYTSPVTSNNFYPLEGQVREKLESALPFDIARIIYGKVGVAGGRIIKEGEVPGDPEGLYNMVPAGMFRDAFGSSGVIDRFSAMVDFLSSRLSQGDLHKVMDRIAEYVVNGVEGEIVGRAKGALKSRESNRPLNMVEISSFWTEKSDVIMQAVTANIESREKLDKSLQSAFGAREETGELLATLNAAIAKRLNFVPKDGIESRRITPETLKEDAVYMSKVAELAKQLLASVMLDLEISRTISPQLGSARLRIRGKEIAGLLGDSSGLDSAIEAEQARRALQEKSDANLGRAISAYSKSTIAIERDIVGTNGQSEKIRAVLANQLSKKLNEMKDFLLSPDTGLNLAIDEIAKRMEYLEGLNGFIDKVAAARRTIYPVLSEKESAEVGEYLLADVERNVASCLSGSTVEAVDSASAKMAESAEAYRSIAKLSLSITKSKAAAIAQLEDLKELESTAKIIKERLGAEASGALSLKPDATLKETEQQLSSGNDLMNASKNLTNSLAGARSRIVLQFRNYTPLVGFGYHLLQVLHNKIMVDAEKLGTVEGIQAEIKFIDTTYAESVMQKIQDAFTTLAESELFSKYRREGHNDVVEIMIRLFNSVAVAADGGETEKIAELLSAFSSSDAKQKAGLILDAHKDAVSAMETKLKGSATYEVVKLITSRLSEEAKAALMKIASAEDMNAGNEFCNCAKSLQDVSEAMEKAVKAITALNSDNTSKIAGLAESKLRMQKLAIMQVLVTGAPLSSLSSSTIKELAAVSGTIAAKKRTLERLVSGTAGAQLGEYLLERSGSLLDAAETADELRSANERIKSEFSRAESFIMELGKAGKEEAKRSENPEFALLRTSVAKTANQNIILPVILYKYVSAISSRRNEGEEGLADTTRAARSILLELKESQRAQRYALAFMDIFARSYDTRQLAKPRGALDKPLVSMASAKIEETAKKGILGGLRGSQPKLLKVFEHVVESLALEPKKANAIAETVARRLEKDRDPENLLAALEPVSNLYLSHSTTKNGKEKSAVK
ncbi:MAG: hypothetical protein LVQ95_02440 [Candidatus Micrarchaeales archaeon]|nr:hypothetical protein [Candidatus Micrarchaeales archaeon]